jgi:hypothetical protein
VPFEHNEPGAVVPDHDQLRYLPRREPVSELEEAVVRDAEHGDACAYPLGGVERQTAAAAELHPVVVLDVAHR